MGEQEEQRNEGNVMMDRKGGSDGFLTCWLRPQIIVDDVFLIMRTLYTEQLNQSDFISGCFYSQKPQEALSLASYRGVLVSTLLHATVYMLLHNLLNVLVQIANKMGLQKKISGCHG
jgi:hypothetical protein